MKVKDLRKGDFFTKKDTPAPSDNQVWIRGDYIRSEKRFECIRFSDCNSFCYLPGEKIVNELG